MAKKSRKKRRSGEHRNKYDQFSSSEERLRESCEEFSYEKIEAELDFHRHQIRYRFEIHYVIQKFIASCFESRMSIIRVITGKGNNSEEFLGKRRAVIKPLVRQFLEDHKWDMIDSYEEVSDGGAFDIRLKDKNGKKKK